MFEEFSVGLDSPGTWWLSYGFKKTCLIVFDNNFFLFFLETLDLDPDSEKCLDTDPDSVNPRI